MTPEAQWRAHALEHVRACARRAARKRPETRSLLFAVAQYWDDRDDDEVHDLVISSSRDVPVWPHFCEAYHAGEGLSTPGEHCNHRCDPELGRVGVSPELFARFCHGLGSQDRTGGENFTPYAIARRRGDADDFDIEVIGKLWRPEEDMVPSEQEPRSWLCLPRARELFDLVCESPADDGPRRVLADYLLEHEHPRGELIALSLCEADPRRAARAGLGAARAPELRARQAELLAAHGRRWLAPLGAVIPETGARWERGFLARADVYLAGEPPEEVRAAPAWGTVEVIRFLRRDLIVPAMVALRDVGPVREGLRALAAARRPWAIERLHAVLEVPADADALWSAATLPRLRHLVLEGPLLAAALERPRPRWWPQLERLSLVLDCDAPVAELEAWRARFAQLAPWVAVTRRSAVSCDLGWEVATGPEGRVEVTLAGWHDDATNFALWELADAVPRELSVWLAPSRHWAPQPADAAWLSEAAGRPIRLAAP